MSPSISPTRHRFPRSPGLQSHRGPREHRSEERRRQRRHRPRRWRGLYEDGRGGVNTPLSRSISGAVDSGDGAAGARRRRPTGSSLCRDARLEQGPAMAEFRRSRPAAEPMRPLRAASRHPCRHRRGNCREKASTAAADERRPDFFSARRGHPPTTAAAAVAVGAPDAGLGRAGDAAAGPAFRHRGERRRRSRIGPSSRCLPVVRRFAARRPVDRRTAFCRRQRRCGVRFAAPALGAQDPSRRTARRRPRPAGSCRAARVPAACGRRRAREAQPGLGDQPRGRRDRRRGRIGGPGRIRTCNQTVMSGRL